MKEKYRFFIITFAAVFCFIFTGCSSIGFDIEETISPPEYDTMAVQGTWKIDGFISALPQGKNAGENQEFVKSKYLEQWAVFDNELGAVGPETCVNPKYRIIKTTADSFIQGRYRVDEAKLGLRKQEVYVASISSGSQLFYELIITDSNTAYVYMDNGFLVLKKTSDQVDAELKEKSLSHVGQNVNSGRYEEDPLLRSGILLGIRAADYSYRTLWIYSKNREIETTGWIKQLLVPRAKGFWQVGTINESNIHAIYALAFNDKYMPPKSLGDVLDGNLLKIQQGTKINFAGNDYIGIEDSDILRVYPVEHLKSGLTVSLQDIAQGGADNIFEQSYIDFAASIKGEAHNKIIRKTDTRNFTLMRRNGHWVFKSRLYFQQPYEKDFMDFDIRMMVPDRLIQYDEMNIPWNDIKAKLPWTSDAFMSPNKDIAVLADSKSLCVYSIKNSSSINRQLLKLELTKGDTIVMAEWSIGRYAVLWDNFVNKQQKMNY